MPAHTVAQLEDILGSGEYKYFSPGGNFLGALKQVYPRLIDMGLWRDMAYEVSMSGQYGYISLPADTDAVLACTINDFPRNTRSQWHDVKITGRQAILSGYYGIVDDGFHPVLLDMKEVEGVAETADVVGEAIFFAYPAGTTTAITSFAGTITITGKDVDGRTLSETNDTGIALTDVEVEVTDPLVEITSIIYNDIPYPVDVVCSTFPTKVIATLPAGSGVYRVRRFRTSNKEPDTTVHLLVKRGAPSDITEDTIIYLGNIGALKHGLLGLIAEDNADLERANFHWGMAGKLLDQELASIFGAAKPTLRFSDPAAGGVHNYY